MKRILIATIPFIGAAMIAGGPVFASTRQHVNCQQIQSQLAAGKTAKEVAKEMKLTMHQVSSCKQSNSASTLPHRAAKTQ